MLPKQGIKIWRKECWFSWQVSCSLIHSNHCYGSHCQSWLQLNATKYWKYLFSSSLKHLKKFQELPLSICLSVIIIYLFCDRVSRSSGWAGTHYIAKNNPELLMLLSPTLKFRDYRHWPTCPASFLFLKENRVSCLNWLISWLLRILHGLRIFYFEHQTLLSRNGHKDGKSGRDCTHLKNSKIFNS